jgi:hypothetical protein
MREKKGAERANRRNWIREADNPQFLRPNCIPEPGFHWTPPQPYNEFPF